MVKFFPKSDITLMHFAFKMGNLVGTSPWYNLNKHSVSQSKLYKLFKIGWTVIYLYILIVFCLNYYFQQHIVGAKMHTGVNARKVFNFLQTILKVVSVVVIICQISLQERTWDHILVRYEYVCEDLKSKNSLTSNPLEVVPGLLLLLHGTIIVLSLDLSVILGYNLSAIVINTNILNSIALLNMVINSFMIWVFAFCLKCRYKDLNNCMKITLATSPKKYIKMKTLDEYISALRIRELGKVYKDLGYITELFNRLYSWKFLLFITTTFFEIIEQSADLFNGVQIFSVANDFYLLWTICVTLSIIISCDKVTVEGKKIVPLCYELRERQPIYDMEREELKRLANMAEYNYPIFTAGGFFEINRKAMLTFSTTVTTYLIIITQLGNEDFTHKYNS